jgi:DNA-binding CsgD family transcriptional regulator
VAEILASRGDERFEPLWERASRLILERPPSDNHAQLFLAGIAHAAFGGEHERALAYTWQVLDLLDSVDVPVRLAEVARVAAWPAAELGRAARLSGDEVALAVARSAMDRLEAIVAAWQDQLPEPTSRLAEVLATGTRPEIAAQRARMEGTDTTERWAGVADAWTRLGRPYRAAMARWHEAGAAEAAGEREAATSALRAAYETAERLGARPLATALETIGRRLRVRLGGVAASASPPERAYGLTARELEVLAEVVAGRTNREIAQRLFISESTAGVHVSNILGKLGVDNRLEAARAARDQGLVGGAA